jgi:hypothetical protein
MIQKNLINEKRNRLTAVAIAIAIAVAIAIAIAIAVAIAVAVAMMPIFTRTTTATFYSAGFLSFQFVKFVCELLQTLICSLHH